MGARSRSGKSTKVSAKTKNAETKEIPEAPGQETGLWGKVFNRDVTLRSDEALLASHWIRQAAGIIIGTIFGILRLTGFPAICTYFIIAFAGPSTLLSYFNELDIDEISKSGSIQTEGFMPSFALFVLSWIISYTVFLPANS